MTPEYWLRETVAPNEPNLVLEPEGAKANQLIQMVLMEVVDPKLIWMVRLVPTRLLGAREIWISLLVESIPLM